MTGEPPCCGAGFRFPVPSGSRVVRRERGVPTFLLHRQAGTARRDDGLAACRPGERFQRFTPRGVSSAARRGAGPPVCCHRRRRLCAAPRGVQEGVRRGEGSHAPLASTGGDCAAGPWFDGMQTGRAVSALYAATGIFCCAAGRGPAGVLPQKAEAVRCAARGTGGCAAGRGFPRSSCIDRRGLRGGTMV